MPRTPLEPVWKRGDAFKDGKLYRFEPRRIIVARPWPDLRAWVKTPCRPWRPTCMAADRRIMSQLRAPGQEGPEPFEDGEGHGWSELDQWIQRSYERSHRAFSAFFDFIPPEVRLEALNYLERRWHLLNLFARCPGGLELSRSNPALAFALANNRAFHQPAVQRPFRSARSLLPKPQRVIQEWLGFPATEPVRRLLRKIAPQALTVPALRALRIRLQDPAFQQLVAHLPVIHAGHLHVLLRPRYQALANPAFLHDLARASAGQPWKVILAVPLWETASACTLLGLPFELPRLRSLEAFYEYHQSLSMRLGAAQAWAFPPELPAPPFPGTETIQPIRTTRELFCEGAEMGHCVASHIHFIHAGREAVYRVLQPQRATLSITKAREGWMLDQVAGPRNGSISPDIQIRLFEELLSSGE